MVILLVSSSRTTASPRSIVCVFDSRPCPLHPSRSPDRLQGLVSPSHRLLDIVHADQKLYLVCEFLDVDLKRYMENGNKSGRPITPNIVKVRANAITSAYTRRSVRNLLGINLHACITRV